LQFEIATVWAMTKSVRMILTPFLIISYVFGLRIAGLSKNYLKLWFSLLYMLFFWLIYYFLFTSKTMTSYRNDNLKHQMCYWLEFFTTLLSVVFGVYHNKVKR